VKSFFYNEPIRMLAHKETRVMSESYPKPSIDEVRAIVKHHLPELPERQEMLARDLIIWADRWTRRVRNEV
jgi:hypothetical protein